MGRLFWKFFFFFWLAQFVTSFGVGLAIWLKNHDAERLRSEIDASPPAAFMVAAAAATLRHGGISALHGLLEENQRKPGPPVFVLDDENRELLGRQVAAETVERAKQWAAQPHNRGAAEKITAADGQTYWLFVPPPAHHGPGPSRGSGPEPRHPPMRPWMPLLVPLLAGGIVSLIFAALLAGYFSKPIRTLRAAFENAAHGRLGERIEPDMGRRRDELADLGRDFDGMTQRLQNLMDGQRRLLHDVSHELRSPLARLQAAIGLARQQPERLDETLVRIERESVRMDKLVSELLTLSRLEAGMTGKLDEDVDLNELVAAVAEDARFEAEALGIRVELVAHAQARIKGNAELLHRALENVVRNALKHTPAGKLVCIELDVEENLGNVAISVSDDGGGVPESELQAIFEPFFRGHRKNSPDGHGLGLAISRRVIAAHHGRIAANNRAAGGLCVTVSLPVA